MINRKHLAAAAAVAAVTIAAPVATMAAATAAPTTVTAVTHIVNRPDSGNGGTWAYDNLTRTLKVTQTAVPGQYTATVTDKGTFTTVQGALTPNQATAGTKVTRAVKGTFSGGISYTITAPTADALTAIAAATEDDNFAAPAVTTASWPDRVFAPDTGIAVTEGAWSWTYKAGTESWTDSSVNGDGNVTADGNITGATATPVKPVSTVKPYVYAGHVITVGNTRATVGWSDSKLGWPSESKCVEVREFGFGFSAANGSPHVGFTCDNGNPAQDIGYLTGLTPGQTYFLQVVPATGTYGHNHPLITPNSRNGVDLVTTR